MPTTVLNNTAKAYIRRNCKKKSSKQMAEHIGCSRTPIQRFMKLHRLTPSKKIQCRFRAEAMTGRTDFTAKEDAFISRNYLKYPIKTLGDMMGRSYTGIMGRLKAMGLKIPKGIKKRNIAAGRIKKGNIPPNKGKKQKDYMSPAAIRRTAQTRFKKGQLPHNTKERDGVITVRHDHPDRNNSKSYKWIRVGLGKWIPYHRYRWEKFRGKIPKGMLVAFKDGDTMNCHINNLELITLYENRIRNSGSTLLSDRYVANAIAWRNRELADTIRKQRPDLIELKRQQLLLNREIKCKTKKKRSSSRRRKP